MAMIINNNLNTKQKSIFRSSLIADDAVEQMEILCIKMKRYDEFNAVYWKLWSLRQDME